MVNSAFGLTVTTAKGLMKVVNMTTQCETNMHATTEFIILKSLGIKCWEQLLQIAESATPPPVQPCDSENWCGEVTMDADDGWKVVFSYDCGELDNIDIFITPGGKEIDFWAWPENHTWKDYLINWREMGDLKRLKTAAKRPCHNN
ncbi:MULTISPECIES: hypothetical protein [unclassified Methylophaga]|uniref:hypothetical protein n=1 Tax=unclassified Methylophaga TaxID=2629249 RepID=UPI000C97484F|nr:MULTISPECIES: hypothetical protein [unclassified Methylophaga]MBN46335.1 hypothetical protein [Methylophaga sp.]|tara:strand:+ start:69330 stop:69767 length:438 start_codon:yes stop_codon:yes gene_type:complete